MKRLLAADPIACLVLGIASLVLIARSVFLVCQNYFIILFWDQWDLVNDFIRDRTTTLSWSYLFKAHNEHVIATSKLLFALDWCLFHFTNLPLVLSNMIFAVVVAWLLTVLVFWEMPRSRFFWVVWLVFCASGLSFAQWENLLWGFQPQFNLVLVGALASIILTLKVATTEGSRSVLWLAALQLAMGFSVFSMASGIAIPVSVLFLLILFRVSPMKCLVTGAFGVFFVGVFFLLMHGGTSPSGSHPTGSFSEILMFFFTMIGGAPFNADVYLAPILGVIAFVALAEFFVRYLILPWFRERKADMGAAALFGLAAFLIAAVAAAAWGRTFHGISYALSSRYATPTLLLWMVLFAVPIRLSLTSQLVLSVKFQKAVLWLSIVAAFGAVVISTLFAADLGSVHGRSADQRQAAYFVASDVMDENQINLIFYNPARMETLVAFLRERKLNIFAPWMGLPKPSADDVGKLNFVKSIPACTRGYVDSVTLINGRSGKAIGWISDAGAHEPRLILAGDDKGHLRGFTEPLSFRPDVAKDMGARQFHGFLLPFRASDSMQTRFFAVAVFRDDETCKLPVNYPRFRT